MTFARFDHTTLSQLIRLCILGTTLSEGARAGPLVLPYWCQLEQMGQDEQLHAL